MLLRSKMATPATKNDVKNISDKLDKISKSLVDSSTSLLQLTEEIKALKWSQQFLSEQYEDMKQRLHSKDEEVKVLQAENQDLKLHVHKLEAGLESRRDQCLPQSCLLPQIKTRNLPSLRGSVPGRPETLYSAKDIGYVLTTRPTLKDAY